MQATLLLALLSLAFAQYDYRTIFSDSACDNVIAYQAKTTGGSCTAIGICTPIVGTTQYFTQSCDAADLPSIGATAITISGYENNQYCGNAFGTTPAVSEPNMWFAFLRNTCVNYLTLAVPPEVRSFRATCTVLTTYTGLGCTDVLAEDPTFTELTNRCFFIPSVLTNYLTDTPSTGSSPTCNVWAPIPVTCFHEDTVISYGEETFTLEALKKQEKPICAIPHEVKTDGVKIKTSCGEKLRLTKDHLVYTQEGLKTAGSVKLGDFLFSDVEEKNVCEVTSVKIERNQNYFGLNCEESVVLANGYKTSTFGVTHDIPSLWMKYASKVFGVQGASAWGDVVANALAKLNLL